MHLFDRLLETDGFRYDTSFGEVFLLFGEPAGGPRRVGKEDWTRCQ